MIRKLDLTRWFPQEVLDHMGSTASCAVSFSGGVDSSVVLAVISMIIGPEKVHAVTFSSWFHPEWEKERAIAFAERLGVHQAIIPGPELDIQDVIYNHPDRCALCKKARIKALLVYAREHSLETIYEGANADDLKDPTRLGTMILKDHDQVYSPLAEAGLSKEKTRLLARELGIEWWNEKATACLATRFPAFEQLEEQELRKVGYLEEVIRRNGFNQVRIRIFREMACLEFPEELLKKAIEKKDFLKSLLKKNGFSRIVLDLEGYSSGKSWFSKEDINHQGGNI